MLPVLCDPMLYTLLTICGARAQTPEENEAQYAAALEQDLARIADEQESANKSVQKVCNELNERDTQTHGTSVARVPKLANGSEHVYYDGGCL